MATTSVKTQREQSPAAMANRLVYQLGRHWLLVFTVLWGLYVGLPWLAPVFMQIGWTGAGKAIYAVYSTQCHQLPQRSYFLFGEKTTYTLVEVKAAWQNTNNPAILRQFIGNPRLGWKVAWSDRMVSMYTSIFVAGLVFWPVRRRVKPISIWMFILLAMPMVIDGGTHMISDLAGIGNGFRDSNAWLAALTGNRLPVTFYAGDGFCSFNSWMRLITGVLFGIGVVWLAYPYIEEAFAEATREIESKFQKAGLAL